MDIFTTQLTRVMPVRIIPDKLKVKALVKEGKMQPLNAQVNAYDDENQRELQQKIQEKAAGEQHKKQQSATQQTQDEVTESEPLEATNSEQKKDEAETSSHLDLYV